MSDRIGEKVEVYSLSELQETKEGTKYFACIGGNKNYECYLESSKLSRAQFMEKYLEKLDKCHIPIYSDNDIIISQDAQIAIPGFFIVATKNNYKNLVQMDIHTFEKCMTFVSIIKKELKENFGIDRVYIYYDEHYAKPSSTHFWVMPIYENIIRDKKLDATILSKDIWKYQDLFEFSKTKDDIYKINDKMRKALEKGL